MCHVSCVTCHMSRVTCHNFFFFVFFPRQCGEAYWGRVCYQQGLPCLVLHYTALNCADLQHNRVHIAIQGSLVLANSCQLHPEATSRYLGLISFPTLTLDTFYRLLQFPFSPPPSPHHPGQCKVFWGFPGSETGRNLMLPWSTSSTVTMVYSIYYHHQGSRNVKSVKSGLHPNSNICIQVDAKNYSVLSQNGYGVISFLFCKTFSVITKMYSKLFKSIWCSQTVKEY